MSGLALGWALLVLAALTAAYAVQGLAWLIRGAAGALGWIAAWLAFGVWALFNRRETARLWREAGRIRAP